MLGGGGWGIEGEAQTEGAKRLRNEERSQNQGRSLRLSGGGAWGGGSVSPFLRIFFENFIPETPQCGVCLTVPARELSQRTCILYVTVLLPTSFRRFHSTDTAIVKVYNDIVTKKKRVSKKRKQRLT